MDFIYLLCCSFVVFSITRLNHLLNHSNVDVNIRNRYGETPLLVCLKLNRSLELIQRLLISGADVMAADNEGITPLSMGLSYRINTTCFQLLLECGNADLQFAKEPYLSKNIYEVVKYHQCHFETFVVDHGLRTETILLCILPWNPLRGDDRIIVRDLNVFLDLMKKHHSKEDYNRIVCHMLIDHSLSLPSASLFKAIWKREHSRIATVRRCLLVEFFRECKFLYLEYIECLHLILASEHVLYFINSFHNNNFFSWMSWSLKSRDIYKCNRMPVLLRCIKLIDITINDISDICGYFKFNVDVVLLLQHIKPKHLSAEYHNKISQVILNLENDPKLQIDNLDNLTLIPKLSYRKLINSAPKELLEAFPVIRRKREIVNQVPKLFDLSEYQFQKNIQKFYNVRRVSQFCRIVRALNLPPSIKKSLCYEPPIYYE